MQNLYGLVWHIGCFIGAIAATSMGQTPTFSLELVEINSIPVSGGGVTQMAVAPRDLLIAKVLVRDWSPNGEQLRGYQAELSHDGFTSGTAGSIRPVGYQTTSLSGLQNPKNAFIDLTDPAYVHFGEQAIAFADTDHISPGYRWISALFTDAGPVSPQNGTKLYCGTLKLIVSEDAEGTFTIDFKAGPESTTLRTPTADLIEPIELVPLTLTVIRGERPAWISSSTPKDGGIDARWFSPQTGKLAAGWRKVELVFSAEPGPLSARDFTIEDGTGRPPGIASVEANGRKVELALGRPITRGAWTVITHTASGTRTRIGLFPGDVNNDGVTDPRDLHLLIDGLNGVVALPIHRTDLDNSGTPSPSDVLRLIAALNEV